MALVSENFARRTFPDGNAIGRRIEIATEPKWGELQIVGIVSNASLCDIRKPPQPTVYMPTTQYGDYADNDELLVRTNVPPGTMRTLVQGVLNSIGREDVMWVRPLSESVGRSILQERLTAMLSGFFGGLGLLLALIGLYGLMAYTVTRRTQEIGIRIALGAQRRQVRRMILGETLVVVLLGVAIGVPCALAATRLIAHLLFGLSPADPATLAIATAMLLLVGATAGYTPARRAMRVDPLVALRNE